MDLPELEIANLVLGLTHTLKQMTSIESHMDMIQYLIFLLIVLDSTMCPMKFFKRVISRMGMLSAMTVVIEKILIVLISLRSMLMFRIMEIIAELIS